MITKAQAREIFSEAESKRPSGRSRTWRLHSENAARAAEAIALAVRENEIKQGIKPSLAIDPVTAYVCGYLHDLGRSVGEDVGLLHPIYGYRILMEQHLDLPAQISMTHGYYAYDKIDRAEYWAEFTDSEMLDFTRNYLRDVELTDYDLLIQLVDNMAHHSGIMSIDGRFADILIRHNNIRNAGDHLRELYNLKAYFDQKAGQNIYDLFRDEIIKTSLSK